MSTPKLNCNATDPPFRFSRHARQAPFPINNSGSGDYTSMRSLTKLEKQSSPALHRRQGLFSLRILSSRGDSQHTILQSCKDAKSDCHMPRGDRRGVILVEPFLPTNERHQRKKGHFGTRDMQRKDTNTPTERQTSHDASLFSHVALSLHPLHPFIPPFVSVKTTDKSSSATPRIRIRIRISTRIDNSNSPAPEDIRRHSRGPSLRQNLRTPASARIYLPESLS